VSLHPITENDLHAYADGRLDATRRAEVEAYLSSNPEAAERTAEYARQNEALRELYAPVLIEPVPQRMVNAATRLHRVRSMALAASWVGLGAFLGLLAGGIAGWELHPDAMEHAALDAPTGIVRNAAIAHATYSPEVRHPVEVGADQEAHLVAWLSKRLGAPLRAPKLDSVGLTLVGGRLLPGDPGIGGVPAPTAQFMYQCQKGRRVTLYVRPEAADHGETAFRYARDGGVGVFYWIDRRFGYALSSSDMDRDELLKIANIAYRQLNP
jgi:anti-sigma factor RsiW